VDVLNRVGVVDGWVAEGSQAANDSHAGKRVGVNEKMVNLTRDLRSVSVRPTLERSLSRRVSVRVGSAPIRFGTCHSIGFSFGTRFIRVEIDRTHGTHRAARVTRCLAANLSDSRPYGKGTEELR
jgi:hypothetical protein